MKKTARSRSRNTAQTQSDDGVFPFEFGNALSSMRASGHDFTSSLAEAIDNSFGHGDAMEVRTKLTWLNQEDRRKKSRLKEVHIADNGKGMDRQTLAKCLVLGYSTTYNDRKGIGRFGFGMTAGALGQCRRIEVYSKTKEDPSFGFVYLDLDAFLKGSIKLSPPMRKDIPNEYKDFVKNHGSLVIWHFLDIAAPFGSEPLDSEHESDLKKLHHNLGRIYRKFIGSEITEDDKVIPNPKVRKILINGVLVKPFDPLYITKISGFEKDPRASIELIRTIPLPSHIADPLNPGEKGEGDIVIRMTLLPKEWRPDDQSERTAHAKARHIDKNEGVSILRNNREVFYGRVPDLGPAADPRDRWWGMEILFTPELDYWFSVKNVKQGAMPIPDLREKITEIVNHTIMKCRETVSSQWTSKYADLRRKSSKKNGEGEHELAERRFKDTGIGSPKVVEDMTEEQKERYYKELSERFARADEEFDRIKFEQLKIKWLNDYKMDEKGPFIDIIPKTKVTALIYNIKHIFFQRLDQILKRIAELEKADAKEGNAKNEELSKLIKQLRYCIDLLLGSYAASHVSLDPYARQEVKTTLLSLMSRWTESLQIVTEDDQYFEDK